LKNRIDKYKELVNDIDLGDWESARLLILEATKKGHVILSKRMNTYYQEHVCKDCLGRGKVVQTTGNINHFGNEISVKCECQL